MAAVALIESEYKPDLRPIYSSDGVIWDLSCFPYTGPHDPKIQVDIATASHYVNIITRTIRGITHHRHLAPDELGNYLELETQLKIALLTPQQYMTLKVVEDERLKDTFQEITSTWSTLWTKLFLVENEVLGAYNDEELDKILDSPILTEWIPYLKHRQQAIKFALDDESECNMVQVKDRTQQLQNDYLRVRATIRPLSTTGRMVPLEEALALFESAQTRNERLLLREAVTDARSALASLTAPLLSELLQLRTTEAHARKFSYLELTLHENWEDQITTDQITTIRDACELVVPVFADFSNIQRTILGISTIEAYDDLPSPRFIKQVNLDEAITAVSNGWRSVDPRLSEIIQRAKDEGWIFADTKPPRTREQYARAGLPLPGSHPLTTVLYDDTWKSARTIAHELGHTLYHYLAQNNKSYRGRRPSSFLNETIALWSTDFAAQELFRSKPDISLQDRLLFRAWSLQEKLNTITNTMMIHDYETKLHERIIMGEALDADMFSHLYLEMSRLWYPHLANIKLREGQWSTIQHLFLWPFYSWRYAAAQMISQVLQELHDQAIRKNRTAEFGQHVVEFLIAGSTLSPRDLLLRHFGVDMNDPNFWELGGDYLQRELDEVKKELSKYDRPLLPYTAENT